MLNKIKALLGLTDTSKDSLLLVLIDNAVAEAKNFCHTDDICELENAICQMVVYNYNRLGTEGVNSESYSGVDFTYSTDYPESIMRQLRAHRKLIVW